MNRQPAALSLTQSEWLVMERLWKAPATLMELVRAMAEDPPGWAKSTTATMVRRMEAKGLIRHDADRRTKVFSPAVTREEAALAETRSLLDKAFDGSVGLLVNTLARQESLSERDVRELYDILQRAGEEGSK